MKDTRHFRDMLKERDIPIDLVDAAIVSPDKIEERPDGTRHYLKKCESRDGRWLRVVINVLAKPPQRVTAFFDRRIRRKEK